MNIQTSNGMGIKPQGLKFKPSNGMGIKTSNGMGLKTSKGMGLSSDSNYFTFNEYKRNREYLFGDRGKKKKAPPKPVPKEKPKPEEKPQEKPKSPEQKEPEPPVAAPAPPLPTLTGNSVGSMKRMMKMFG